MWKSEEQLYRAISCNKVNVNCNKKKCKTRGKKCIREKDGKIFSIPRLYSRKECNSFKKKGFTQKSSCAPYESV